MLDALWDLVWAGEVTNDTFSPLRALRWKRPAKDRRPRPGRLTSLGPPEAAGRWSLVDGPEDELPDEAPAVTRTERRPRARPRAARAPRRRDPRGGRERADRGRVLRRLPGPAGDGGGRADPARLLRRRARCGAVRAAGRGGPAAVDAGPAGRDGRGAGPGRPAAGRGRPGQPVRGRAAVAAARRRRPAAVPAGRRRLRRAGRRRGGRCTSIAAGPRCRRCRRRTIPRCSAVALARSATSSPTAGCASS